MGPILGREALEAMKRVDIQKLCKDYGVKANLKTEALIDLLLDASRPQPPRHNPPRASQRPPSARIPNFPGARPRGQSTGSIIVHGSEDEAEPTLPSRYPETKSYEPVPQRTRKAKQTQYRLGVGRPAIAGGTGARAITKSTEISRTPRRIRSSKSIKPSETTITEEPEPGGSVETLHPKMTMERQSQPDVRLVAGPSSKALDSLIADALAPIHQELDTHKAQLTELKEKVSSLVDSFETKIRNLTSEIQDLRAQARNSPSNDTSVVTIRDHSVRLPEPPSTPKRVRTPYLPFAPPAAEGSAPPEPSIQPSNLDVLAPPDSRSDEEPKQTGLLLPGFPNPVLGKRHRDSIPSSASETLDPIQEGVGTKSECNIEGPVRKRAKTHELEEKCGEATSISQIPRTEPPDTLQPSRHVGGTSFPVFSEREDDLMPPTERPPNFYGPTSPPVISAPSTSSANNVENQNPFSFTFVPITSTPTQAIYPLTMGTFPHPEPPTSPSPAANPDRPGSRHSDRLGAFGIPRSSSRGSGRAASGGSLARGETGGSSGLQRVPSSNEIASGLGLTAIKTSATEQGIPAPPAKRTMYGTELDGDTRFGDFGVEGVASGFWAGGRF